MTIPTSASGQHDELRDALRALCNEFPAEYHRGHARNETYPVEFIDALTRDGWLAAMIPEEFGGAGPVPRFFGGRRRDAARASFIWVDPQPFTSAKAC